MHWKGLCVCINPRARDYLRYFWYGGVTMRLALFSVLWTKLICIIFPLSKRKTLPVVVSGRVLKSLTGCPGAKSPPTSGGFFAAFLGAKADNIHYIHGGYFTSLREVVNKLAAVKLHKPRSSAAVRSRMQVSCLTAGTMAVCDFCNLFGRQ